MLLKIPSQHTYIHLLKSFVEVLIQQMFTRVYRLVPLQRSNTKLKFKYLHHHLSKDKKKLSSGEHSKKAERLNF